MEKYYNAGLSKTIKAEIVFKDEYAGEDPPDSLQITDGIFPPHLIPGKMINGKWYRLGVFDLLTFQNEIIDSKESLELSIIVQTEKELITKELEDLLDSLNRCQDRVNLLIKQLLEKTNEKI